jgi:hypothetical protein
MSYKIPSVWLGMSIGALISLVFGWVYLVVLRGPGSAFYAFAGLVFLAGPLIGGIVAMSKNREHRGKAFLTSGSVIFGIAWMLFTLMYVVLPQFERTSVQLPAFCNGYDGSFGPPSPLAYTLPNVGTGVLITSDAQSAVVVMIEYDQPPFPSTVFLVNKSDNKIVWRMHFKNDVISATINDDTLYLYNDKLGYFIDARTGEFEKYFLTIDNYGGLSKSDRPIISRAASGHWYMETTAMISSWNVDGTVKSRPHLTFNAIALGCFISGETHDVTKL